MYGVVGATNSAALRVGRMVLGGPIAKVDESTFMRIVNEKRDKILIVHAEIKTLLYHAHVYATNYRGFTFITKTREPLHITPDVEAEKIWIPVKFGW